MWLWENNLHPSTACEWDDLLVEWKHHTSPTKTNFCNTLAALEFFFVTYRGNLSWSHQVKAGWEAQHIPNHTVPMLSGVVRLYAVHCSCRRQPRLGIGMLLQQAKGLRPSEMLKLQPADVTLPGDATTGFADVMVIGLGIRGNTKAKRPQSVTLRVDEHAELIRCIILLCRTTPAEEHLFPYTLEQYNKMVKAISADLGHGVHYTPHSCRAGFCK